MLGLAIILWPLWLTLSLILVWFILSLKIVGPDEIAVKVYFGNPVAFCDSGFQFVPYVPEIIRGF
ncbi:MAG: hypothetical protein C0412_09295, partial [Flavobacterium sp.]|nr:hypothetical protein [Flavobacterium sp.]